jgi:hypothetical protein
MKELNTIQTSLAAPKGQRNNFGNYNYRSCEDILAAAKPLLKEQECTLTIADDILLVGDRFYIKATATITNKEGLSVCTTAFAREEAAKKGMDASQVTGAASSYARKYALCGLFAIDGEKDADATNTHGKDDANLNANLNANDNGNDLTPHEIIENEIKPALEQANTKEEVLKIYEAYKKLANEPGYKTAFSARRKALGF